MHIHRFINTLQSIGLSNFKNIVTCMYFCLFVVLFMKMDSEIEEMSRLICSLPALHKLLIGCSSSQLTDKLTQKFFQQAVSQTWKGKVLRVESSFPGILQYAFESSQKLIELNSFYLIHHLSHSDGNMVSSEEYTLLRIFESVVDFPLCTSLGFW